MKRFIIFLLAGFALSASAQDVEPKNKAGFELGKGLNFAFNQGAYQFKLSGMIQPYFAFSKEENVDPERFLNVKRSYFNFSGQAQQEKLSFFFQLDFSQSSPLLDAWVAYHPCKSFSVAFGQKQNIANNREMLVMENVLQFPDRSLLSQSFSRTGREFGIFADGHFGNDKFGIAPQIAITSGDGRNSFGTDSRDVDLGGLKYSARLDIFPLGFFSEGNENLIADLAHEASPKLVLGIAGSYNDGASQAVGEGHGEFFLYDVNGGEKLPDYRQLYADLLFKFQGISFLGEYAIATATNLEGSYTDVFGTQALIPTQISEYLHLGRALNAQLGYVTRNGYALDVRYGMLTPEFEENSNSLIRETTALSVGFSKYFKGNDWKIQTAFSTLNRQDGPNNLLGEVLLQLVF